MTNTSELTLTERLELIVSLGGQYCTALKSVPRTGDESIDSEAFYEGLSNLHNEGSPVDVIPYLEETIHEYSDILPFLESISERFSVACCNDDDDGSENPEAVRKRVETEAWFLIVEACRLFRSLDSH